MAYYISWRGEAYGAHKRTFERIEEAQKHMDLVIEALAQEGEEDAEEELLQSMEIRSVPSRVYGV